MKLYKKKILMNWKKSTKGRKVGKNMELHDLLMNAENVGIEIKEENDCVWFIYQERNREHQQFIPKTSNDSKEFLKEMERFLDKIKPTLKTVGDLQHHAKMRELTDYLKDCLEKEITVSHDNKFDYMMLSRLQSDCEYYLGNGNRHDKHLWAGNAKDQIDRMKEIYNSFPDDKKPDWISMADIENYENKMCNETTTQINEIEQDDLEEEYER